MLAMSCRDAAEAEVWVMDIQNLKQKEESLLARGSELEEIAVAPVWNPDTAARLVSLRDGMI